MARANRAIAPRFAGPTKSPANTRDWRPRAGPGRPCGAWARETKAPEFSIASRSTTPPASSYKKLINQHASRISPLLEAEPFMQPLLGRGNAFRPGNSAHSNLFILFAGLVARRFCGEERTVFKAAHAEESMPRGRSSARRNFDFVGKSSSMRMRSPSRRQSLARGSADSNSPPRARLVLFRGSI
jgi:hypothetical protein